MENEVKLPGDIINESDFETTDVETNLTNEGDLFNELENFLNNDDEDQDEPKIKTPEIKSDEPVNTKDDNSDDDGKFTPLANYLSEKGIIDLDTLKEQGFELEESEDSFIEAIELSIEANAQRKIDELLSQLPKKFQKEFKLYVEDGLEEKEAESLSEKLDFYSSLDQDKLKDSSIAEKVVRDYYETLGMDKEEIDEIVSRATELDELSEKAEKLSKKLESKVSKEIELKKEEAKVNQQKALEKQKEYFDNMKKSSSAFIQMLNKNGIGFNQKLADEIYKSRTEVVEEENGVKLNKIGAISRKDPEGFQNTMHLLSALGVFKTDKDGKISPDLSKLTKIGESKGAKKVITKVDEISKKFSQSKSTDDDFEDPLELLKETYG